MTATLIKRLIGAVICVAIAVATCVVALNYLMPTETTNDVLEQMPPITDGEILSDEDINEIKEFLESF